MRFRAHKVGILLFGSGLCALTYQVAWLRELRLVFGNSTAASSCVLAIFMGGLGLGSALLGRYAEAHRRPLALYARLQLFIAISAAATPLMLLGVRHIYIALGGSLTLGMTLATLVRLGLSSVVLGVPTFLMGGTLPAAGKSVETELDVSRGNVAVLYGLNTLGAVAGAAVSTFFLLEVFGLRTTLWLAALLNVLVAVSAGALARQLDAGEAGSATGRFQPGSVEKAGAAPPAAYVLAAAGVVGFAFFLMELVWYRMLGPVLGGTTYTFGLILAVALAGIGLGGALYAPLSQGRPGRLSVLALSIGIEAVCIAVPFALGDRLAVFSDVLRLLGAYGFGGYVAAWSIVCGVVVFPAALVAGFQFPLLIALLGQGRKGVARETGFAYASNTVGAIAGALAGGFGLLPLLTAAGTWRAVVLLLAALGLVAILLSVRREKPSFRPFAAGLALVCATALVGAPAGPTAAWRHSGIGAGRSNLVLSDQVGLQDWLHFNRRNVVWEAEGIETSVALTDSTGYAFVINGKTDGHAITDASTQVMFGLVGAAVHPGPKRAMVIGLGTGCSAGWLGRVDSIERVDVVELEPAIMEVARRCAPVNANALGNSNIRVIFADGREILLTAPEQYDLVVSEPSNPYRAGIASLYTKEFYEAVVNRLTDNGIFLQWVQGYEIDAQTIKTIYATLGSVFAHVETWQTNTADLLLMCSQTPRTYDVERLRKRIAEEPFRTALANTWRVTDLEGFLAHYVAAPAFGQAVARQTQQINTDDRTLVEFGFARTLGRKGLLDIAELYSNAAVVGAHRPPVTNGEIRWDVVDEQRFHMIDKGLNVEPGLTTDRGRRIQALAGFLGGDLVEARLQWQLQRREPVYLVELLLVAESCAEAGENPDRYIEALRRHRPVEALAIEARYAWRTGRKAEALDALTASFAQYRENPWPVLIVMERALGLAQEMAAASVDTARRLAEALAEPFAVHALEEVRRHTALDIASRVDESFAVKFVEAFEPHVPWNIPFLQYRYACYARTGHRLVRVAERQLRQIKRQTVDRFSLAGGPASAAEGR